MRLLNASTFEFRGFSSNTPPYAVLSHRWSEPEPTREDIEQNSNHSRDENKVFGFADYIRCHLSHIAWIWVDSCCINQKSDAELSEGVNLMFRWYKQAEICIAYLADVQHPSDHGAFERSVWFKRGWTLQELVAPNVVIFVAVDWQVIGHKGDAGHLRSYMDVGPNLESSISAVTSIPVAVLRNYSNSHRVNDAEKMSWMKGRQTLREEDMSYALFGIFGVTPGANYGEESRGAERRLQLAIAEKRRLESGLHAAPSNPAAPLCLPINTVPFPRDSTYVHRTELDVVQQKFAEPGARVVLVGLGGIGHVDQATFLFLLLTIGRKSQLAIEYCYRLQHSFPNTWVLWIHASNATRFDQDVRKLANDVKIPGREDESANIYELVRNWLTGSCVNWLIVLDSADDVDYLFEAPELGSANTGAVSRIGYLSIFSHGAMLITTRRKASANRLVDDSNIVQVQPDRTHAIELLKIKLSASEDLDVLEQLAATLEYMPLAITQAAAYINKRKPRCTIQDYLTELEKNDGSKSDLLQLQSPELRRDHFEANNSILTTWHVSFEYIYNTEPYTASLLSLMSFYDHQGIPEFLLKAYHRPRQSQPNNDGSYASNDRPKFDEDKWFEDGVDTLRDYSFLSVTSDRSMFRMHRLVQLAAQVWLRGKEQSWLGGKDQFTLWQTQSLKYLNKAHPVPEFEHWEQCRALFPHVKLAEKSFPEQRHGCLALALVLRKAAGFAQIQSWYTDAVAMAERSVFIYTETLGPEDLLTLSSMTVLARAYWSQSRREDSEKLVKQILDMSRQTLEEDHPIRATNMSILASILAHQGSWREAEELTKKAMELTIKKDGKEGLRSARFMLELARIYRDQDRWKEAEEVMVKILEVSRRTLGDEHLESIGNMYLLAVIYYESQTQLFKAHDLLQRCVDLSTLVLGPDSRLTRKATDTLEDVKRDMEAWDVD